MKLAAGLAALTMALVACGDDAKSSSDTGAPPATAAPGVTAAPAAPAETVAPAPAETDPATIVGGTGEGGELRLWLNGGDTPDDFVKFAIGEFNKAHPDVKVTFERQQWTGIAEKLTTSLASSDSPDVIELGNTQAQAFEAAGALKDLTADKAALGGDDLLQSLVEAGTYDGKFYGVPYYAGARVILYRKDLFAKSGLSVPTTIDEMMAAATKLKADNASTANFSGMYLPGKNWFAALPFIWVNGGDIAVQDGSAWKGALASDKSVQGLTEFQKFIQETSGAPKDGDDSKDYQKQFAENGTIPALKSLLGDVSGSEAATAQAKAAENSRFVPSSENWAAVETAGTLQDMIVAISGGADVKTEAAKADSAIEAILNG
jgi:N,N'-diacetylchitobiose transport system substrate-binding protein